MGPCGYVAFYSIAHNFPFIIKDWALKNKWDIESESLMQSSWHHNGLCWSQGRFEYKVVFLENSWATIIYKKNAFKRFFKNASLITWAYIYWSKVNIWNVNCARATAFIFDTRMGVLVKVSTFLRQKISRPEGDSNPQHSDSCRML